MTRRKLEPIHPGEVLAEEFLKPLALTQYRLAKGLRVPARRINEIVHGKRAITADTALRLGRFFGNTPEAPNSTRPGGVAFGPAPSAGTQMSERCFR